MIPKVPVIDLMKRELDNREEEQRTEHTCKRFDFGPPPRRRLGLIARYTPVRMPSSHSAYLLMTRMARRSVALFGTEK